MKGNHRIKFKALELLRLITLLPLVIVLFAMAGDGEVGAFQQTEKFASHEQGRQRQGFRS